MQLPKYRHRTHKRAKSLKLTVEPNGEIVVTTPVRYAQADVQRFVADNVRWIERQQQKLAQQLQPVTDTQVMIFGKWYQKTVDPHHHLSGISVSDGKLVLVPVTRDDDRTWQDEGHVRMLDSFLKHTAQRYIRPRLQQLAQQMDVSYNNLAFKQQKTRWGSCSSQGNLNFNWRLVHYQPAIIDYVLIHELAHLRHLNHSAKFWALVAKHDPHYQTHRRWLKKHAVTVH